MAIIYWLIDLRQAALDITFERIFLGLFLFQDYWLALVCFLIALMALFTPLGSVGVKCAQFVGSNARAVSSIYFVLLAFGAVYIYHAHPLSMDEYAPNFQSQVFAAGQLAGRLPTELLDWLVPPPFQNYFLNVSRTDGAVVSAYWPGFALLLTPFTLLGVPWLCNPVLGAVSALLIHRLAKTLYGDDASAGLAVLLAIAAPAFTINAISFYSMTAHLAFNAGFTLLLLNPSPRRAFIAGVVGSFAFSLHNPVPHALFAVPWVVWLCLNRRWAAFGALIAGYVPLGLLLVVGWAAYSGTIKETAASAQPFLSQWLDRIDRIFTLPNDSVLRARTIGAAKLWIWAVPASIAAACVGGWARRADWRVRLLAASALLTLAGYLLVPFDQGHGWGYRYFHSAWFVIPILAAGAVARSSSEQRPDHDMLAARGYLAATGVLAVLVSVPLSAYQVEQFIARHLAQLPEVTSDNARLVIVHVDSGYYAPDLVQNDPFARNRVLILYSHGRDADREMLSKHFPELQRLARDVRGSVWGMPE